MAEHRAPCKFSSGYTHIYVEMKVRKSKDVEVIFSKSDRDKPTVKHYSPCKSNRLHSLLHEAYRRDVFEELKGTTPGWNVEIVRGEPNWLLIVPLKLMLNKKFD